MVERGTENPGVAGSTPACSTIYGGQAILVKRLVEAHEELSSILKASTRK